MVFGLFSIQRLDGLLDARAFLGLVLVTCSNLFVVAVARPLFAANQSEVAGSATGGGRLLSCLAMAAARALQGGSAEL